MRANEATFASNCSLPVPGVPAVTGMELRSRQRSHPILRHPDVQEILDANTRIEPVSRLDLGAAAQIEQNRIGDVLLGKAELGSLRPVNGELESRQIRRLLHPHVHGSAHMADFVGNRGGDLLVAGQVTAQHLNVERRRQPKIDGLADDVRRQEIKSGAGKIAIEREAQIPDIIRRWPVSVAQRDQNVGVGRAGHAAVAIAEVDAGNRQANIVENALEFSAAGISRRIAFSTRSTSPAVSSIRVPVWARTCSRKMPASTVGKKSCPRNGTRRNEAAQKARNTAPNPADGPAPSRAIPVALAETIEAMLKAGWPIGPTGAATAGPGRIGERGRGIDDDAGKTTSPASARACGTSA